MKRITKKMMAGTVALACLTLGAGGLHAQITQVITITASASIQGNYSYSYNAKTGVFTYTYAAPTKHSVATKDILGLLATDYNTTFPSGAKLVTVDSDFQVVDKSGNLVQDVSGIMSFNNPGVNDIFSGKSTSPNRNLGTFTDIQLLTISFDDTGIGGPLSFFLTGVGTGKTTDTPPNANTGAYTETDSGSLSSGTGEGTYLDNPFICTGTASATGKGTLNINAP